MNILVIDDEEYLIEHLQHVLQEVFENDTVRGFCTVDTVLSYVEELTVRGELLNYAFLDISLCGMSGIELAKHIRQKQPNSIIIFCTAHSEYALDAFSVGGMGYLTKPVEKKDILNIINNIRKAAVSDSSVAEPVLEKLCVRTNGTFDVFYKGSKVVFERQKAKEMLAYLIDRRMAGVTNVELAQALWHDKDRTENVRTVRSSLIRTMKQLGLEDVIVRSWNQTSVNLNYIDCDAYTFIDGSFYARKNDNQEYMSGYDWAKQKK